MSSDYESFWTFDRYVVVGNSSRHPFPRLTYGGLKHIGKTVYAVDPSTSQLDGDPTFSSLTALPGPVQAAVLEVPPDETAVWMKKAIDAGIKEIWLHRGTDSPEAVSLARDHGVRLRHGTCAVMYLDRGLSFHSLHRFVQKLRHKF
jgi:uncharacterized protein